MRLGFVSAILPELTLDEVVAVAGEEGYKVVEVMCWPKGRADRRYAGVTHIDVGTVDDREVSRIAELHKRAGVSLSGLGYYPNPLAKDEKAAGVYIEHLKEVIQVAARLGVHQVNTFIGREIDRDLDYNLEKFARVWKPIVALAEAHGVRIGIENCSMFFTRDEWPNGANIAPIYEFTDRIFHVHLKDAKILRERLRDVGVLATPLEFHAPKLPGLGEVNWGAFFSALTDIRYAGPVCVEVEDHSFEESLESRKAALRVSRNYLKQFLPD